MKSGGITRFKFHLTHNDRHNNTKKCPRVPLEVKEEIQLLVHDKNKAKAKKVADIQEILAQLRGTMGTRDTHLIDEDDDDDEDVEDEDVYMYPTYMHSDERDAYRSAVRASKASEWESRQKNIKDILNGGAIKETMGRLINKFFIYESIAPAKAKSHHFKNMIIGAQQAVHCIYLIFEDIGKRPSVIDVINTARKITNFIYNHGWLLAQMRKYCGGDIVRPGATIVPTMPFVYKLMHVMKENLIRQGARDWLFKLIKDCWEKTLKHPLHAAVNVKHVLSKEVHSESFSKDTDDSVQMTLNSHQVIDSTSASHSSRPSAAGTSAFGYDGSRGGIDDGGDNAGGDIYERQHSQYPISQFTFGPCIGAIGKPYRGRERTMEPYSEELLLGSFESMSIRTQFSDSSNEANVYPPHVVSYGQPSSSTDEEYGMSHCSPSKQIPYQVPYQMEG
ncbi:hypothetical protein AAG906_037028 [Vitis piasezkii]